MDHSNRENTDHHREDNKVQCNQDYNCQVRKQKNLLNPIKLN